MTDWLARRVRGVIDFRLPGDPLDIPPAVERARILEYYAQVRAAALGWNATKRQEATPQAPGPPKPAQKSPRKAQEPPPSQPGWWLED